MARYNWGSNIDADIPSNFLKLGKCRRVSTGSTCSVFEIVGGATYILKVISCNTDVKHKNALYEINMLKKLRNENNVVQMIDFEIVESQESKKIYILMRKYIPISKYVSSNTVTAKDAVSLILQLSKVLKKCVDKGILHLDVSPKNIYLNENNEILLGDFGSSLLLEDVVRNNSMRGTLDYIAPEVYRNGECSELSDLYSVGLIFYKFFNAGKLPFAESNSHDVSIYKRLAGTPLPCLQYPDDDAEQKINQIVEGTCSFEKKRRFQSFEVLIRQLEELYVILYDNRVLSFEDNKICFADLLMDGAGWSPSLPGIEQTDYDTWDDDAYPLPIIKESSNEDAKEWDWDADDVATSVCCSLTNCDDWDDSGLANSVLLPPSESMQRDKIVDAIAALREQLAGGGETLVNQDGIVLNPADPLSSSSLANGDGFKPIDKAVVAGSNTSELSFIKIPESKLAGGYGMCRFCGAVFNQTTNFCPECGTKTTIDMPKLQLDKVFFSAIAPKSLMKGDYSIIDIYMYEEEFRHIVDRVIKDGENNVEEKKTSGVMEAERDSKITVVLSSKDIEIEDNREEQIWHGKYLNFSYAVELPDDYVKKQILFVATVYINDVIATRLKFIVKCKSHLEQKIKIIREDVLSAFVSYASQDRNRVAMIIQGMRKARPDMDIFFDVDSLRSGDDWEKTLWREIDNRDVLYLCWSKYARDSKWVNAEWRYALENKGIECIEPVPTDSPNDCPPPKELEKMHFNDKILYIINA